LWLCAKPSVKIRTSDPLPELLSLAWKLWLCTKPSAKIRTSGWLSELLIFAARVQTQSQLFQTTRIRPPLYIWEDHGWFIYPIVKNTNLSTPLPSQKKSLPIVCERQISTRLTPNIRMSGWISVSEQTYTKMWCNNELVYSQTKKNECSRYKI
jgi:hypothetical protein